ncbi:helix-turn-helix transcriptional regulator [Speluncibacter jeojiensis]|uniref:Winged helix-turn-helix transcriptional regulator n=1 Tax=Speluncibacter jeojiensis TaxID=2710754 RepID=A0A9X4LX83_9ACTN|nr:winged helix-turn-helix transcriptional regulator [Corynebacteriales bacterium D3-21]
MAADRQRDRVLELVRAHQGPIDAQELARATGLHVTTVRFHVDALCESGLVQRVRMARSGVGRPRTGYEPTAQRVDYRALAEVLALELGSTPTVRSDRARQAGRRWAARLTRGESVDDGASALDRSTAAVAEAFAAMGFVPVPRDEAETGAGESEARELELCACPIRGFAREHPEVACQVHAGLLEGLAQEGVQVALSPFVEPELCVARLAVRSGPAEPAGAGDAGHD